MKKKIDIINFHFAFNYGAVLQCYALQKLLEKQGNSVRVIDYRPYGQMQYYYIIPRPIKSFVAAFKYRQNESFYKRLLFSIKWGVNAFLTFFSLNKRMKYKKAFSTFVENNFNLTCRYKNLKKLQKNYPDADIYLCGSDQIWNPDVTFGYDGGYFLNFGPEKAKRIAYAPSPNGGMSRLDLKKDFLKSWLSRFDHISLRESQRKEEIEEVTMKNVSVVLDPTLLLDSIDYESIEEKIECPENFILFYGFDDKSIDFSEICKSITKKYNNIPLINISIDNIKLKCNNLIIKKFVTPGQFVYLIKKSSFVITNSFHAIVFSILYSKQFLCIKKTGTSARMVELLNSLNLADRINDGNGCQYNDKIDYISVYEKLNLLRLDSLKYLNEAINDKETVLNNEDKKF